MNEPAELTPDDVEAIRRLVALAIAVSTGKPFKVPGLESDFRAIVVQAAQLAEYQALARRLGISDAFMFSALLDVGAVFFRKALEQQQVEVPDGAAVN